MPKHESNGYTDEPLGDISVIDDFLPSPENLVFKEDNVKITLGLSKRSVDFFKGEAKKHRTQYQKMIRRLLDLYVAHHEQKQQKAIRTTQLFKYGPMSANEPLANLVDIGGCIN